MVFSVVVVALMVATLAIFLYAVGVFFSRTSGDLENCVQNLKKTASEEAQIGLGVKRINGAGRALVDGLSPPRALF